MKNANNCKTRSKVKDTSKKKADSAVLKNLEK